MSLFGFHSKHDDDHAEEARRSAKAELARTIQDAKAEYERNPSPAARNAFLDAERQFNEL